MRSSTRTSCTRSQPGNEAEITLDTYPGHVIKAHVDSVIWAQSQGQIDANGNLPQTTFNPPPGQFPVKLVVVQRGQPALPRRRRPRRRRDLHRAPVAHSPHSQGADQDVVVFRLHHHQAPHQPPLRDEIMVRPRLTARGPLRLLATALAIALAATVVTGCVLNKPPERGGGQRPLAVRAAAARAVGGRDRRCRRRVLDDWLAGFNDDQLTKAVYEALNHNADLQRRGHAGRAGAAVCEAGRREAVSVGRCAGARRRQALRRRLRYSGRRPVRQLGARPLGPRPLRPRRERRASRVGGGGLRVRPAVDCGTGGEELVHGHGGGAADRGGARHHPRQRGSWCAWRTTGRASGSPTRKTSTSRAPPSAPIRTRCANSN